MNIRLGLIGCGEHSEIGHAIPLAPYAATHAEGINPYPSLRSSPRT